MTDLFTAPRPTARTGTILDLDRVSISLRQNRREMVSGVSLSVRRQELFGIAGESGSGKTMLMRAIFGLHDDAYVSDGSMRFDDTEIRPARHGAEVKKLLGRRIGFVPQDPFSSLNPSMRVGRQITEALYLAHGLPPKSDRARQKALAVLAEVGIPEPEAAFAQYPDQFSGGMRQRIVFGIVLSQEPDLLVADEPTTALDASTQRRIVDLIVARSRTRGVAVILISHNLELLRQSMDRVAVLYSGQLMNVFPSADLGARDVHPYTDALFGCIPTRDKRLADIRSIPGEPAGAGFGRQGCAFADRCTHAAEICRDRALPSNTDAPGRFSACLRGIGGGR